MLIPLYFNLSNILNAGHLLVTRNGSILSNLNPILDSFIESESFQISYQIWLIIIIIINLFRTTKYSASSSWQESTDSIGPGVIGEYRLSLYSPITSSISSSSCTETSAVSSAIPSGSCSSFSSSFGLSVISLYPPSFSGHSYISYKHSYCSCGTSNCK